MKNWTFQIDIISKDIFFPKERLKNKIQIINILLEASRYILSNPEVKKEDAKGEIRLVIDKMSRLFFVSDKKSYSIIFPFKIYQEEDQFSLSFHNNIEIDSYLITQTKSAINCNGFEDHCVLGFADTIHDIVNDETNEDLWFFVRELMLLEDGYIRYDNDPNGFAIAKEKGVPHKHPLDHYDLFYTNAATFKIGLEKDISTEQFIDLLNRQTDCYYLKN
ncbi:hypothetical protein P700755_000750 [Psychroflexus torquis ATCC 700755]|jgi:hypothetical protein|uniref:Uncharacterized protein n=1 Tax=Psychroflexus torquis (strain ATCC 700755 / CIP 106069 / ACAM 623) TaxID=313595 RepID=K4IBE7_PSYTT|nr:hypothetical protein [Psychroflexus torquis]AFU67754.1 hypothetical protein P700755_000750 [Psychroflexus torquis ATCC 700755]